MTFPDTNSYPTRTLLVGCGRTATRLGENLVAGGREVVALRRTIDKLPDVFTALSVDLLEPVEQELPEVDAMVITLTPGLNQLPDHPNGYLDALNHLTDALPSIPERVVFVSSTRVFEGKPGEQVLTGNDASAPITPRGETLLEAERAVMDLFNAHIVRPAGIYGPGREMIRKVVNQTPVQYAQRTNRIHEIDLARALEVMLTLKDPPHPIHAVDQSPATMAEVVTFIADQLGLRPPPALQPEEAGGTVLGGGLLLETLGSLHYPTFEAGYRSMLT